MGQILTVFPEQPSFRQSVTLGAASFQVRLTWRNRLAGWYADIYAANGDAVLLGQRVAAGWAIGAGLNADGRPDGPLFVRAPDEFERTDLGNSALIVFYSTAEIEAAQAAAAADEDAIVVVVP